MSEMENTQNTEKIHWADHPVPQVNSPQDRPPMTKRPGTVSKKPAQSLNKPKPFYKPGIVVQGDNTEKKPERPKQCFRCKFFGHVKSECKTKICDFCKGKGHLAETCRKFVCRNCKKQGHIAKDCPNNNRPKYCNFCKKEGHQKRECVELKYYECPFCGELGHMQRDCRSPYMLSNTYCEKCGMRDHHRSQCRME